MDQHNLARQRLKRAFRFRVSRAQVAGAVLLGILGFGATVQVRTLNQDDTYATASRTQLIQILDQLGQRSRQLESEIAELESTRSRLSSGADKTQTAVKQAEERAEALGILAGTAKAKGPGIKLTMSGGDEGGIGPAIVINTLQEMRDAGAEAIEINNQVRVVASSYVVEAQGGIDVDGKIVDPPYVIEAIGDSETLASAMQIPGGVEDSVEGSGGQAETSRQTTIRITSLHRPSAPRYASPAPESESDSDSDSGN